MDPVGDRKAAARLERPHGQHEFGVPSSLSVISPLVAALDLIWIVILSVATGIIYDATAVAGYSSAENNLGSGMAVGILYSAIAHVSKLYQASNLLRGRWQVGRSALTWLAVFASLAALVFLLKSGSTFSRGWVLLFFVSGLVVSSVLRFIVAELCSYVIRSKLIRPNRIVLVGLEEELIGNAMLSKLELYGYSVCKIVSLPMGPGQLLDPAILKERMRELVRYVRQTGVDEVVIAMPWAFLDAVGQVESELRVLPIPIKLVSDQRTARLLDRPLFDFGPTKALQLQRAPLSAMQRTMKRSMDQLLAASGLIVLLPMFAIISIAIRLESPGRSLFLQQRAGFNGKPFKIYKFRTMNTRDDGPVIVQAKRNDHRITRLGALLRKLSIDEIPQLINVLRGEMSLVGPRPHALAHDSEYDQLIATYAMRHKIKPGITGWAQVNGFRGETPEIGMMKKRVESDLWYIESWSIWLDLRILVLTVFRVLKTDNVY
jgi:Undecaprenyl-phosphate glucose phosphotransferase